MNEAKNYGTTYAKIVAINVDYCFHFEIFVVVIE